MPGVVVWTIAGVSSGVRGSLHELATTGYHVDRNKIEPVLSTLACLYYDWSSPALVMGPQSARTLAVWTWPTLGADPVGRGTP